MERAIKRAVALPIAVISDELLPPAATASKSKGSLPRIYARIPKLTVNDANQM
jgi:hypothetical protein